VAHPAKRPCAHLAPRAQLHPRLTELATTPLFSDRAPPTASHPTCCAHSFSTILTHYHGHRSKPAFLLSLPHLGLSLPSHCSVVPGPPPFISAHRGFRVTHGSRCHDHVRRLPITTSAEASFVFPSSLHHPVSIPISPLHHTLLSRRSTVARARRRGLSHRPAEQPHARLRPHLPEKCPGIELSATKHHRRVNQCHLPSTSSTNPMRTAHLLPPSTLVLLP
jgi:hypothetical protein